VLKAQFPVEEVVLYGSSARGTDEEDSDIDLLVLTTRPVGWQDQERVGAASLPPGGGGAP